MVSEAGKEQFKVQKEILFTAIRERFKILPTLSALSATLLVVATFNPELISVTILVKVILAILLLIIPISLFGYLFELKDAEDKAREWFERFGQLKRKTNFMTMVAYLPWTMFCLLSLMIVLIVILIFTN